MNKAGSEPIKFNIIKTDTGKVFISDYYPKDSYQANHYNTKISGLKFDGEFAQQSGYQNWFTLSKLPEKVTRTVPEKRTNYYFKLKDKFLSTNLPKTVQYSNLDSDDEDYNCYDLMFDKEPEHEVEVEFELEVLCQVSNLELPEKFDYRAIMKNGWNEKVIHISDVNLEHSMIHKLILPAPLLSTAPCKLSSQTLYAIVRQHVIDNIDNTQARITSNYDFCFTVKKKVPLIEPEIVRFTNPFESTKKKRTQIHVRKVDTKEVEIFEMTHAGSNYKNYTPIPEITGTNQQDLKDKLDNFLEELMETINKPLKMCECCKGNGYEDVKMVK